MEKSKENKELKWHPNLTEEQIDDAIQRGIDEPVGQEYEMFLREHGINFKTNYYDEQKPEPFSVEVGENNIPTPATPVSTPTIPTSVPTVPESIPTTPVSTPTTPTSVPTVPEPIPTTSVSTPTKGMWLEKSGLQIFREQFNQMPEIKNRHTASERYGIVMPLGIPAAAAASAFINPFLGIPVVVGTAIAKPIIYRATGQKKLEDEIKKQFLEMDDSEFNRMVDYLSEEQQANLKPNAIILNSLHKAMIEKTKVAKLNLDDELASLKAEKAEIVEKAKKGSITEQENTRLGVINDRIISITDHTTTYDENGKPLRGPSESEIATRRLKEVRRGKDRISAKYKKNLKTRFNIFAHRNSTTKEYSMPINNYADAERKRDEAIAREDHVRAAEAQDEMEEILYKNTYTNGIGVQKSVFNAQQSPIRIISDKRDRTVETVATLGTIGIGITKTAIEVSQAKKVQEINEQTFKDLQETNNSNVDKMQNASENGLNQQEFQKVADGFDQQKFQKVADGQVTEVGTAREHAVLNEHGDFTSGYHTDDLTTQNIVNNMANNSTIKSNKPADMFHQLADIVRNKVPTAQELANSASNPVMGADTLKVHQTLLDYEKSYPNQVASEADLFDKCGDLLDAASTLQKNNADLAATVSTLQKNNDYLSKMKFSWLGTIITAAGGFIGRVREAKENRKMSKEIKEINEAIWEKEEEK